MSTNPGVMAPPRVPEPCVFKRAGICCQFVGNMHHGDKTDPCEHCEKTLPSSLEEALDVWKEKRAPEDQNNSDIAEEVMELYDMLQKQIRKLQTDNDGPDEDGNFPCVGRQLYVYWLQYIDPRNPDSRGIFTKALVKAREKWIATKPQYPLKHYHPCSRVSPQFKLCDLCENAVRESHDAGLKELFHDNGVLKQEYLENDELLFGRRN